MRSVIKRVATPRASAGFRYYQKSSPTKFTENKELTGLAGFLEADNHVLAVKMLHVTSLGLMAAVPLAFVMSPSPLVLPVDIAMGILLPVHAHIGMNNVIIDYVPKNVRTLARLGWLGATSIMFIGLVRVNMEGPGITEVIKTVWRESPTKKKVEA